MKRFLRGWFSEKLPSSRAMRASPKPRRLRPGVEALEDRLLLSTYTVNTLADVNPPAGSLTLRQAILDANSDGNTNPAHPDVINFSVTGTISLASQLPALTGSVSIQGTFESYLTISGDSAGDPLFTVGAGGNASVSAVTLAGNFHSRAFAVDAGATLSVANAFIEDCSAAGNGGAIDSEAGGAVVNVSNTHFVRDGAGQGGGAIANVGGTLNILQGTFDADTATNGGSIYDSAGPTGGGGQLQVLDSTFSNNAATAYGGSVELDAGASAVIGDCTLVTSNATTAGGAISLETTDTAPATITLDLSAATVYGNTAGTTGGGLYVESPADNANLTATAVVRDTILAANEMTANNVSSESDVTGPVDPSSAFNLISVGTGLTGTFNGANANQIGSVGTPINPRLGLFQNNGGPTVTMAPLQGSPAIDQGGPDPVLDALTSTDQRGDPRVVVQSFLPEPTGGDGRDIGACELGSITPTVLTVNSLEDANPPAGVLTLRQAIEAADGTVPLSSLPAGQVSPGSSFYFLIQFSVDGTITLGSQLPALDNSVTIRGPGQSQLTVTGDQLGDALLTVAPGASAYVSGVTLDGAVFTPGYHNSGIVVGKNANLVVSQTTIQNAFSATEGGAIDDQGGDVVVYLCNLVNDYANTNGGAIAVEGGALSLSDSTLDHDQALDSVGGGVYVNSVNAASPASVQVLACTFSNDDASQEGGGLGLFNSATATVEDSTFTADYAGSVGGAISARPGSVGTDSLTLVGSTVDGNTVFSGGLGGGVYVAPYLVTASVRDSIVAGNLSGNAPSDVSGPLDPAGGFNLIGDGSGMTGLVDGANGNQVGTDAAPINPLLGPLQNNGGPTLTQALLPGSPALDRGGPDSVLDGLTSYDQRGYPRVVTQSFVVPPPGGDGRDIGAYELAAQTTPTVLTVDSLADANPPAGVLTLREAIQAADGSVPLSALPASQVSQGSDYFFQIDFSVTGTIALGSQLPALANAAIAIQGPGQSNLTITGDQLGDPLLTVAPGAAASVSGLTLDGSALVPGYHNAGIAVGKHASLQVSNATIQNAFSPTNGGGIDDEGGNVAVDLTNFVGDFANYGGGIAVDSGSLTVSRSTFNKDQALGSIGGGIYVNSYVTAAPATATVEDCTFSNDDASEEGGGLGLFDNSSATVSDSTFTADYASSVGGAISVRPGDAGTDSLTLVGSTVDGNTVFSGGLGGGVYVAPYLVTASVRDTIVAGNLSGNAPSDVSGPLDAASAFNLIGDGTGLTGISNGVSGNQIGTDAAPIIPLLGPLQNNGGPTLTQALLPDSPALDAGSGEATSDTDQRGVSRGRVIDIGAYQATASQLTLTTNSPATAGEPQDVTVQALDSFGKVAYDDRDLIAFTSSDPDAILPGQSFRLSAGNGSALVAFGTLGNQSLSASDAGMHLSAEQAGIVVQPAPVVTVVNSSLDPSTYSQAVTFTASVESNVPDEFLPSGSVTFLMGTKTLGVVPLTDGMASITTSALPTGSDSLTAVYSGDAVFASDTSAVLTQAVDKATTSATLTLSPVPTAPGQTTTLTATISRVAPAAGVLTGVVTFLDGSTTLGTARLNSAGVASLSGVVLGQGNHSLTAVWGGDSNDLRVTSPPTTVNFPPPAKTSTTTTLSVASPTSVYGQSVTFTALVTGTGGTPTGTVTFMEGTKKLGMATLSGGSATFAYAGLAAGSESVTAVYGGDASFAASTSTAATVTVSKATSATVLTVSPSPSTYGQLVTLTAVVSINPPGGGVPTGEVTFRDGSTTLGSVRMNGSGVATFQTTALAVGTHKLTAVWGGDSNNVGSTTPVVIDVVNPAPSTDTQWSPDSLASIPAPDLMAMLVSLTSPKSNS